MICVWWNYEDVLHFELVPDGRAVDAELYCQQLDRVYDKLKQKYPHPRSSESGFVSARQR